MPLSPVISTVASVGRDPLQPVDHLLHLVAGVDDPLEAEPFVQPLVQFAGSAGAAARHRPPARRRPASRLGVIGFSRKLNAPCCIASTALGTEAWPVTMITSASGRQLLGAGQQLHAVDVVHHQVGDDDVVGVLFDLPSPLRSGGGDTARDSRPAPGFRPSPARAPGRCRRSARESSWQRQQGAQT